MIGVDLNILTGDLGDRVGEDRRRVQKIFCSQTSRAGGNDWLSTLILMMTNLIFITLQELAVVIDYHQWWLWLLMMMDFIPSGERDQSSWVSKTMELWERKSWGEIFLTLKQIDSIFWNTVEYKKSGDWTNSDNYFNVLWLQNIYNEQVGGPKMCFRSEGASCHGDSGGGMFLRLCMYKYRRCS